MLCPNDPMGRRRGGGTDPCVYRRQGYFANRILVSITVE